jgi:4-diphosphocytidyl-2-C-methyl-D-erythritol kinase
MSTLPARAFAPAKINLGLFVGPARADGRHELVSVMQSISLADELTLEYADSAAGADSAIAAAEVPATDAHGKSWRAASGAGQPRPAASGAGAAIDTVVCPGVEGPPGENLAARALAAFRAATGWDAPPLRLSIVKRIPVAAGLGGGSADAAAALRLAAYASGLGDERLLGALAAELGADVPAQVAPGRWLARGAGEILQPLPPPNPSFALLVLPLTAELSTAAVYAEADRLGRLRNHKFLDETHHALHGALDFGAQAPPPQLLANDLEMAARSLCPPIATTLAEVHDAGADLALVSGSGPTVIGLFLRANGLARAARATAALGDRTPAPICAEPVDRSFGRAAGVSVGNN